MWELRISSSFPHWAKFLTIKKKHLLKTSKRVNDQDSVWVLDSISNKIFCQIILAFIYRRPPETKKPSYTCQYLILVPHAPRSKTLVQEKVASNWPWNHGSHRGWGTWVCRKGRGRLVWHSWKVFLISLGLTLNIRYFDLVWYLKSKDCIVLREKKQLDEFLLKWGVAWLKTLKLSIAEKKPNKLKQ